MLNFRYIGPVPLLFKGPIQVNNWTTGVCVIEIHLSRSATALPLYHQIEQQISWQIIKGRLNYGEYLPPLAGTGPPAEGIPGKRCPGL